MAAVTDPAILAQLNDEPSDVSPVREPSVAADVGRGVVAGVPSGLASAAGISGDIREGVAGGAGWLAGKFGASPEAVENVQQAASLGMRGLSPIFSGPTSQGIKDVAHQATGVSLPEPKTRPGQYAKTITEFAANPISYVGPGGAFMKAVQALSAGAGSEFAGGLFSDRDGEPYARIVGAVTGALAPRAAMRAITPLPIPQNKQASIDILAGEGVTPTAGQQSGSKSLRYMEGELGDTPFAGGAATREQERIGREYTNAVLARVGERWRPNERITDVVDRAHVRNGQMFDNLASRTNSAYDNQYINDLLTARNEYEHLFTNPLTAPIVGNILRHETNQLVRNPSMDGATYRALRSRLERGRRGTRDPELQQFYATVRQAADDLVERQATPELAQAWRETRNQYRNLLVLDRVATAAGQEAAQGNISPAHLRSATIGTQGRRNYARGQGDFADLARAGEDVLTPLPQSGTAPRSQAHRLAGLFAGLGGAGGYAVGDVPTAIYGATAGAGVPAVMGRALMSRPVQGYLRNQAMTRALRRTSRNRVAAPRAYMAMPREDEEE